MSNSYKTNSRNKPLGNRHSLRLTKVFLLLIMLFLVTDNLLRAQCIEGNSIGSQGLGDPGIRGQSFTANCDGIIEYVELFAAASGTISAGTVTIYNGNSVSSSDEIHSEPHPDIPISASGDPIRIYLTGNVPVTNGSQYTFRFYVGMRTFTEMSDVYSGGNLWYMGNDFGGAYDFKFNVGIVSACAMPNISMVSVVSDTICQGDSTTLSVTGSLNSAQSWYLYTDSCGGVLIAGDTSGTFNVSPSATTTYYVRGEDGAGCVDESASTCMPVTITVNQPDTVSTSASICDGDSYNFGGQILSASGTYYRTLQQANGCDSIIELDLTVHPTHAPSISATICEGDSYALGGKNYTIGGTYRHTFPNQYGCDSVVQVSLTVTPVDRVSEEVSICQGEQYVFAGQTLTQAGSYTETFQNSVGCDSIVTLQLDVNTVEVGVDASQNVLTADVLNATYQWVDCDNNYAPISGATGKRYIAPSNGNYAVIVTSADGCVDTSECVAVTNVGISEIEGIDNLEIYPNPAAGTVNLKVELTEPADLDLYIQDSRGRVVYARALGKVAGANTYELPLDGLAAGVYHVVLRSGEGYDVRKLIVIE